MKTVHHSTTAFFFALIMLLPFMSTASNNPVINNVFSKSSETTIKKVTLKRGTIITMQLTEEINSVELEAGNLIEMMVLVDVKSNNETVISAGTYAEGSVSTVKKKGIFGKGAMIQLEGNSVQTKDGQRIPIKSMKKLTRQGRNRKGLAIGASIALPAVGIIMGTPLLVPFALVGLVVKGRDVIIPAGTLVNAKITDDVIISLRK